MCWNRFCFGDGSHLHSFECLLLVMKENRQVAETWMTPLIRNHYSNSSIAADANFSCFLNHLGSFLNFGHCLLRSRQCSAWCSPLTQGFWASSNYSTGSRPSFLNWCNFQNSHGQQQRLRRHPCFCIGSWSFTCTSFRYLRALSDTRFAPLCFARLFLYLSYSGLQVIGWRSKGPGRFLRFCFRSILSVLRFL